MDVSSLRTTISGTSLVDVVACRRELAGVRTARGLLEGELNKQIDKLFPVPQQR